MNSIEYDRVDYKMRYHLHYILSIYISTTSGTVEGVHNTKIHRKPIQNKVTPQKKKEHNQVFFFFCQVA